MEKRIRHHQSTLVPSCLHAAMGAFVHVSRQVEVVEVIDGNETVYGSPTIEDHRITDPGIVAKARELDAMIAQFLADESRMPVKAAAREGEGSVVQPRVASVAVESSR